MSHNQSRAERSESTQYRKIDRSGSLNQQRNYPAGVSSKGGGGASYAHSNFSSRSFKKYNNSNGQGGQSSARTPTVDIASAAHDVQNNPHQHQPDQRVNDVPMTSDTSNVNQTDALSQKVGGAASKAPLSDVATAVPTTNVPAVNSESGNPTTQTKGDASKSFPLQFGSISPGLMNGVQVPARTSSAPPNLDEQKKDQTRRESLRAPPAIPIPSVPKHHLQKKDDQNNPGEPQSVSKSKRDPQISALPPPVTQTQKPAVHPIPSLPMHLPYHQPHIPLQFRGPSPQIQSQAMSATSLPLPMPMQMPLPIGNPQMQQPVLFPSLQPHTLHSQGIMHQGQIYNFSSPMGHQLPPQMGNIGINMGGPPQYPQPQTGKFTVAPRKTVKITHPETHEELRLDGSSGPRSHPNVLSQSQPITSFPPNHPMNFYHNSYNAHNVHVSGPGSVPLNSNHVPPTSQPLRISKQVTVKPPVGSPHVEKESLPAKSSTSVGKAESKEQARLHNKGPVRPIKEDEPSSSLSSVPQSEHDLGLLTGSAGEARNVAVVSDPVKDKPNEAVGQQDQFVRQSAQLEAEDVITKSTLCVTDLVPETAKESLSTTVGTSSEASNSTARKTNCISEPEKDFESSKSGQHSLETSLNSLSLKSPEINAKKVEESSDQEVINEIIEKSLGGNAISSSAQVDKTDKKSDEVNKESAPILVPSHPEGDLKPENEYHDNYSADMISPSSTIKDKVVSDANAAKAAAVSGKKKKKHMYLKAEAAGVSSDLYNAYKGPEEKKEPEKPAENINIKPTSGEVSHENDSSNEKPAPSKMEPDDWEDAAENSPQLETSKNENGVSDRGVNLLSTKKYSRDFLLKFMVQCIDLPEGFGITPDADALMVSGNTLRESSHSPGRNIDRPGSRDRRSSGLGDDDKWNKFPGPLMQGRGDIYQDVSYQSNNTVGFRSGQASNHGVLRNPRPQVPIQHAGGIYSGSMHQFYGLQPPQQRNNSDSDRWQRGTGFTKGGMMPSPSTIMHRAESKYEVGKVTDEEQAKQRQLKGILNKLTPQNFEKLFQQVKEVNIDNVVTLSGVIAQIFDKALMEPTFCEMYADFCFHLAADLPELSVENEKITFKRLLLNKCQEEFERGEREEEEANKAEEGESKQTAEEREENRLRVRRRMLGNIRLIGELYKKRMLTERIMHECINKLLGQYQNPDEENIEALCKLMSTIGEMIDHPKAKDHMDAYFDIMAQMSNNMRLSSRVRFMLKDSIDLRRNKWQQRRKVEGPKKIEDVHRDAAQERHAQSNRLSRIPSMGGSSSRRGPPMDFASRGPPTMVSSQGPQVGGGGFRGGPHHHQVRGYGYSQDARTEERNSFENRILPQRAFGDDNITLVPQGGLVRGMGGFRGQTSPLVAEGNGRRLGPDLNGFNSLTPDRVGGYVQREDLMLRNAPDNRFVASSNYNAQERSAAFGNRELRNTDQGFDRSLPTPQGGPPSSVHDVSSDRVSPEEEGLRNKSIVLIEEFYSARDEKEVTLCIKDLNTPSFYPSMISSWLIHSFERKDNEREVLTNLLINLSKSQNAMISEDQLIKGFESVLSMLEDAVNDAPRAAEFLGHIFARVILENVIPLSEIGRLIYEAGEVQGSLVEVGLAGDVLGNVLDSIKSEKGDSVLNDIRSSSNLQLENFRPPGIKKSLKIDKYM